MFMLIAGVNFVLHYRLLAGRPREVWKDSELRYFLGVVGVATVIAMPGLLRDDERSFDALRLATFPVVSILTTTGYGTANFETWPSLTHLVFIILMVLGGMSGSTGGGVKSLRALIGLRALLVSFDRLIHPRLVRSVKYAGRPVDESVVVAIWALFYGILPDRGTRRRRHHGLRLRSRHGVLSTDHGPGQRRPGSR